MIVNGGRLIYLAGQVANLPDGSVAGVGDWKRQAEQVYANIGNVLQAAGASPAQAVKERLGVRRYCALARAWDSRAPRVLPGGLPRLHPGRDSGAGESGFSG